MNDLTNIKKRQQGHGQSNGQTAIIYKREILEQLRAALSAKQNNLKTI